MFGDAIVEPEDKNRWIVWIESEIDENGLNYEATWFRTKAESAVNFAVTTMTIFFLRSGVTFHNKKPIFYFKKKFESQGAFFCLKTFLLISSSPNAFQIFSAPSKFVFECLPNFSKIFQILILRCSS